ncbi:hypothetical protein MNBD_GAMMA08-617 [hydrothermal vent metagenome]|uniref:Uncharacterized protein n=1 Tax=hydrothermal vent metagenome TaxID=652676 RepID=A0A3B0XA95_9ZZZZ
MKPLIIQCLKIIPALLLAFGSFFSFSAQAKTERVWPIITFTCDQTKNEVKLKNEVKWGDAGKNFPFNPMKGTYNPWDLVAFEDRGKRRLVSEKKRLKLSCKLGQTEYKFVVRPKIFNTNFNAKCGDRLSVLITIYKGNATLIEDKPMEAFCRGNSPVLKGVKIKGGQTKVKFYKVKRSQFY